MKKKTIILLGVIFLILFMIFFLALYNIRIENPNYNEKTLVNLSKCIDGDTASFKVNDKVKKYISRD